MTAPDWLIVGHENPVLHRVLFDSLALDGNAACAWRRDRCAPSSTSPPAPSRWGRRRTRSIRLSSCATRRRAASGRSPSRNSAANSSPIELRATALLPAWAACRRERTRPVILLSIKPAVSPSSVIITAAASPCFPSTRPASRGSSCASLRRRKSFVARIAHPPGRAHTRRCGLGKDELLVADAGRDCVLLYRLVGGIACGLELLDVLPLPLGTGPRHLARHGATGAIYVSNQDYGRRLDPCARAEPDGAPRLDLRGALSPPKAWGAKNACPRKSRSIRHLTWRILPIAATIRSRSSLSRAKAAR